MKTNIKPTYTPGQQLALYMQKPNRGQMPVARTDSGMVCLIAHGTRGFFTYGSQWLCEVVTVEERKLIVKPVELLKTAEAAAYEAEQLIKKIAVQPREKRTKTKRSYPYLSAAQLHS